MADRRRATQRTIGFAQFVVAALLWSYDRGIAIVFAIIGVGLIASSPQTPRKTRAKAKRRL